MLPNKNEYDFTDKLSVFIGGFMPIPFFGVVVVYRQKCRFRNHRGEFIRFVVFVWRQLEFAFFGALTSVGALFIFTEKKYFLSKRRNEKWQKQSNAYPCFSQSVCASVAL